ncbi:MAG: DUF1684 domain-containing protein [Bacteroidota bacterium]|nr:DUF1684 domain-containing protein [Bacteroidota bacterium]
MKKYSILLILLICAINLFSQQNYKEQIKHHRKLIVQEHLADPRSPLEKKDIRRLHYFGAAPAFNVQAQFTVFSEKDSIMIPTSSGKLKPFVRHGEFRFKIHDEYYTLTAYKSAKSIEPDASFFVPFFDKTNGKKTYGGGRFLDLSSDSLKGNIMWIDFNHAYNPWCAYSSGFNCPIPPAENNLAVAILAGEKSYTGKHKNGSKSKTAK